MSETVDKMHRYAERVARLRAAREPAPRMSSWAWGVHMAMVTFQTTAVHLRNDHGIEPTDDVRLNIALHAEAHGYDLSAQL